MTRRKIILFATGMLVISLCWWMGESFAQEPASANEGWVDPEQLRSALAAQRSHEAELLAVPGVLAVGTGVARAGGAPTINVFLNVTALGASRAAIPQHLDGVAVQILESEEIRALDSGANHQKAFPSPVPMGVSTGNNNGCFTGTLGFRVHRTGNTNNVGYITNNHVAAAGGPNLCPNKAPLGEDQFQPGLFDTGCAVTRSSIGDLNQFVPLSFSSTANNKVDAAFVKSNRSKIHKTILDIGSPSPNILSPSVGQTVQKSGRTTGYTKGRVNTINATVVVNYGPCGTARFVNQAIVAACCGFSQFSAGGDSGSPVLSLAKDGANRFKPVGLLFAGSSTITVINPIAAVLNSLGVKIDSQP